MPTKKRREREAIARARKAEARAKEIRLEGMLANVPDYLKAVRPSRLNEDALGGIDEYLKVLVFRLKGGLLTWDENGRPAVDKRAMRAGAAERNQNQSDIRRDQAQDLHQRYLEFWGKRGQAKRIALDNGLSVRTVQKYFKDFP